MEKVKKYEQIILQFLEEQESYWNGGNTPIEYQVRDEKTINITS